MDIQSAKMMDIVFVLDASSSMSGKIEEMKDLSSDLACSLTESGIDYRFGLVSFRDFPISCGSGREEIICGESSDFPYKVYNDGALTDNLTRLMSWFDDVDSGGGEDKSESILAAMMHALNDTEWRDGNVERAIILITDASPHPDGDCCNAEGNTLKGVTSALVASEIEVYVVGPQISSLERIASETGGSIYNIDLNPDFRTILRDINGEYSVRESMKKADIVFVFDTTGSMDAEIQEMKSISKQFADDLIASGIDYRLGLTSFKDFPTTCGSGDEEIICGEPSDFPYKVYNDGVLSDNSSIFKSWLDELDADGGEDIPEAILAAIKHSVTDIEWREGDADKVIILITDALPHPDGDCCNVEGNTLGGVISALTTSGIKVYVIGPQVDSLEKIASETGGKFYLIRLRYTLEPILKDIAGEMGYSFKVVPDVKCEANCLDVDVKLDGKDGKQIPHSPDLTEVWMYLKYANGTSSRYDLAYDEARKTYNASVKPICGSIGLTFYGKVCSWSSVEMVDVHCEQCPEDASIGSEEHEAVTIIVPDDFAGVQEAVNAAKAGDTIEVHSGTYYENVDLNKPLSLKGVDTGAGAPVVDAGGNGCAITLSADKIALMGFVATNSSNSRGQAGISVMSSNNIIMGNRVLNNGQFGIYLDKSASGNIITGNIVERNAKDGICFKSACNDNIIIDNDFCNNAADGIYLSGSDNNIISDNDIRGNGDFGIHFSKGYNNNITANVVTNNGDNGMHITWDSSYNDILRNEITGNEGYGIHLSGSSSSTISDNVVRDNENYGIHLCWESYANIVCGNKLIENRGGDNAYDDGTNQWDDGSQGNYYSDFECIDADGNGICDSVYNIAGGSNVDRYPLSLWSKPNR